MTIAKKQQQQEENKKFIFTTKNVSEISEQMSDGVIIKRYMNPWFKGEVGVRRSGISFGITQDEVQEYIRCMDDVQYFAEKYCQIKREDGSIGPIKLRDYQKGILDLYKNPRVILCASRQSGKALRDNSYVWTIYGKKFISDLKVGEKIFGDDGKLTTVTGVFPQGKKQLYKITFSDNTSVECCGEHLWGLYNHERIYKVMQLNDFKDNYLTKRGDSKFYTKVAPCVEYETKELKIDPYFLGLLIGDGGISNKGNYITSIDESIINYCREEVKNYNCELVLSDRCTYRITTLTKGKNNILTGLLDEFNLKVKSYEKHIPNIYLISDKSQRIQLLQGLMDTDGCVDSKKGGVEFCTTSKQLSIDFVELCNSLGIKTSATTRQTSFTYKGEKKLGRLSYRIKMYVNNTDFNIFKLERKNVNVRKDKKFNWATYRGIEKIEKIEIDNCTCISVDNKSKLFLTNNFIPTHNTINAAISILHFITFNNDKNVMIVANLRDTTIEIVDKIKSIYVNLPFFLKVGIKNWNQKSMVCENGCKIRTAARSKAPAIGFTIDFLYLDEFAHIPSNIIEPYYTAVYPIVSAVNNSKIVITSTPKGMNLFYKLLIDSERDELDPLKTNFKSKRIYWYEVEGRFVTYFRLFDNKLFEYGVTKEEVFEQVKAAFPQTKVEMKWIADLEKHVIHIYNKHEGIITPSEDVKKFMVEKDDKQIFIQQLAYVTTWQEETIKEIGGEDAFNQEYGLRFVDGSRSLLSEALIDDLLKNKKPYIHYPSYEFDRRLKFNYEDLKFVDDTSIFSPLDRKKMKIILSVDISEGLGQDYSVINMFRITPKPIETIENYKREYKYLSDFFHLQQFGIYRSNLVSVRQLAELFYVLAFEYFDPENVKAVVEYNTYGGQFLAEMPHLFDGNNNYGSGIFFRYKHRIDSEEEKIGLRITSNKEFLVKDYQEHMNKRNFEINNATNINEITTFIKHVLPSGNIRYAADTGNDDTVMTIVNASSVFSKFIFREMVESAAVELVDANTIKYFNDILKNQEYPDYDKADYSALNNITRQRKFVNQYGNKNTYGGQNNWF